MGLGVSFLNPKITLSPRLGVRDPEQLKYIVSSQEISIN